jgi:hypothetical protein
MSLRAALSQRLGRLERRLVGLKMAAPGRHRRNLRLARYRNDPVGYARDVLGVELTEPIAEALQSLLQPPHRVSVDSGHGVGKTHGAAVAVNWWYDTRDPCWVITTAPTDRDVKDLLWTEVRLQRQRARVELPYDLQPAAPEMRSGPEHVAKGYTARDANSAQGRHRPNMLFVFDEKEGVGGQFWDGARSMFRPDAGDAWLVIGNPLTTTSRAAAEHKATDADGNPSWHRVRISALDHPNIAAGLRGEPPPIPGAVTVGQVDQWVNDWADLLPDAEEHRPGDFEWRGRWYRPGPIGEARILGLRPSAGMFGVWSEALWAMAVAKPAPEIPRDALPVIGCDVANYGTDYTVFHVRRGPVSVEYQAVNGWGADRIVERLRQLVDGCLVRLNLERERGLAPLDKTAVAIHIDDDSTGRAVSSFLVGAGYRVHRVNAQQGPIRPDLYGNARSELWFHAAKKAAVGQLNLSRLGKADLRRIELQALAPEWWPDAASRRVVESKDDLRKPDRLGRSPDDMDAINLCYYEPRTLAAPSSVEVDEGVRRTVPRERDGHDGKSRCMRFGRG